MKKQKQDDIKYITLSTVKERGWTDKLIKEYLPTPHKTATNPHYKSAAPMKLYELNKIINLEENIQYVKDFIKDTKEKRENSRAKAQEKKDEINRQDKEIMDLLKLRNFNFTETKEEIDDFIKNTSNNEKIEEVLAIRYRALKLYQDYFDRKSRELIQPLINEFGRNFKDEHFKYVLKIIEKSKDVRIRSFGYTKSIKEEVMDVLRTRSLTFNETLEEVIASIKENSENPNIKEDLKDSRKAFQEINQYFDNIISIKKQELREEFRGFFHFEQESFVSNILRQEKESKIKSFGYEKYKNIVIKFPQTKGELIDMLKVFYKVPEAEIKDNMKKYSYKYVESLVVKEVEKIKEGGKKVYKIFIKKGRSVFRESFERSSKELK